MPNDVDVHHVDPAAFADSVDKDCRSLADLGFLIVSQQSTVSELEIVFSGLEGILVMNWVLVEKRPRAIIDDPHFGTRASFSDVITRKIEMYSESLHSKHRDDLLALLEHSASMAAEITRISSPLTSPRSDLQYLHHHTHPVRPASTRDMRALDPAVADCGGMSIGLLYASELHLS
ncbi:hypothetical protein AJ87_21470 [Rhizobium yanglingense]|nr:hypothetical protein AJ87_21470 [Rhizobium yanglingense]